MTYKLDKQCRNKDWLVEQRFRFAKPFSDEKHTIYHKFIPIWRQGDNMTLELRISVCLENGDVQLDMFDSSFHGRYAPYYLRPSYYQEFLDILDNKIKDKLDYYQIKEIKDETVSE